MKVSIFPDTSGDVIVDLRDRDNGNVELVAVEANGQEKQFGQLLTLSDGGGHIDAARKVIADDLGLARNADQTWLVN